MKKILLTLLIAITLLGAAAPAVYALDPAEGSSEITGGFFRFDLRSITHEGVDAQRFARSGINFVFERVITILAVTVGSAAVLAGTIGGFMILASAGRQAWVDNGKSMIFKSLAGLGITLGAYILVQAVQLLIKSIYG